MEDAFDTRAFAFNRDDERAQRVAGLALMLMNASSPVPTQSVRDALYPDRSAEAFDRAFLRDRRTLGELGVQEEQVEGGRGPERKGKVCCGRGHGGISRSGGILAEPRPDFKNRFPAARLLISLVHSCAPVLFLGRNHPALSRSSLSRISCPSSSARYPRNSSRPLLLMCSRFPEKV